jgi:hypothetical protein
MKGILLEELSMKRNMLLDLFGGQQLTHLESRTNRNY